MNDIAPTLVGDSNQLSKADLMDGPQTFTVTRVDINLSDKKRPTTIHLAEAPGKPYKPSLGMRKLIAKGWGKSSKEYVGRRLTLFHNPDVLWQGKREGGVEVCAMSHIEAPFTIQVAVNAKQAKTVKVEVIPDSAPSHEVQPDWQTLITEAGDDVAALRAMWTDAQARGASEAILNDIKNAATTAQSKEN